MLFIVLLAYGVPIGLPDTRVYTYRWKRLGVKCLSGENLVNLAPGFFSCHLTTIHNYHVALHDQFSNGWHFRELKSLLLIRHYRIQVPDGS